jgi:hypothetical protein
MSYWTAELSENIEDLARIEQEEVAYLEAAEVDAEEWWDGLTEEEREAAIAAAEAEYDAHVNA